MSFFFTKPRVAPLKRGAAPVKLTSATKTSKDSLNRLGCKACPLDKADNCTPKMQPDIIDGTDVYFLGEHPDEADDKKAVPFSSRAGKLLRDLCRDGNHSFDNVVRDFDPREDSPGWVAMECCRNHVVTSIQRAKPKIVVGLGILPLQWMLSSSDMIGLRGRIFAVQIGIHKCWFMPTYSPQYVIDNAYKGAEPLRSKLGHCLKFDIARAIRLANELEPPAIHTPSDVRAAIQTFNGHDSTQLPQVLTLIRQARSAPEKAIDIETSCLRPYAANALVLTVAISFNNTNFAFAMDHPKAGWKKHDKDQLKQALKDLLSDKTKIIAHNAPFECEWFIFLLGRDVIWHDVWECTMMQAHFLDERRGKRGGSDDQYQPNPYQSLDFLVRSVFGLAYKQLFKLDRRNMVQADLDETLIYNAADTKYTLRINHYQQKALKRERLLHAYREAVARQPTVALMQSMGIATDGTQTRHFQKKLGAEIEDIEKRIEALNEVQAFRKSRGTFNPASGPDVIRIFKEYIKVGKLLLNEAGKESVDKAQLARINHPLAKLVEEFRNRSKLKSTYVDSFEHGKGQYVGIDNKIHPSFNTTFAETGRTSSDEPNQQNWPSRNDKWVRKQIIAEKGHVLVAFDYGQLEGCTGAMCSKDVVFVKALWEDYDMHMEWARRAATLWPAYIGGTSNLTDKDIMEKFRSLVKNKMVFPAFFGAAKESIAGYLTVATGVEAPKHVIEQLFNEFWRDFSGTYSWQKELLNDYYEKGYVESLTGRRRHYPLSRPQAINYPVQSVACDVVCNAMVRLSQHAASSGKWYFQPTMNIHDDLTFSIPDDPKILEPAIETIYRTMLTPPYDFVNVPLSVSCSIGSNWLDMDKIGKFWSHKDI